MVDIHSWMLIHWKVPCNIFKYIQINLSQWKLRLPLAGSQALWGSSCELKIWIPKNTKIFGHKMRYLMSTEFHCMYNVYLYIYILWYHFFVNRVVTSHSGITFLGPYHYCRWMCGNMYRRPLIPHVFIKCVYLCTRISDMAHIYRYVHIIYIYIIHSIYIYMYIYIYVYCAPYHRMYIIWIIIQIIFLLNNRTASYLHHSYIYIYGAHSGPDYGGIWSANPMMMNLSELAATLVTKSRPNNMYIYIYIDYIYICVCG